MAGAEQKTRDYTKSDDAMLEQELTMRNLFNADKSDFTAMYPHLANPFSASENNIILLFDRRFKVFSRRFLSF